MPFPAAALGLQIGSSVLGGLFGDDAAEERERGITNAINTLNTGYDRAGEYLDPRLEQERDAMERVNALLGLGGSAPDYDLFRETPGYEFAVEEAIRGAERTAAARGNLLSGNTLAEVSRRSQGLADTAFNNYLAQVMGLQNQGVDAARAGLETERAANIGNMFVGQGEARASGVESVGNALIGGLQGASGILMQNRTQNKLMPRF